MPDASAPAPEAPKAAPEAPKERSPAQVLAELEAELRRDAASPKLDAKERIAKLDQAVQIARDLHSVADGQAQDLQARRDKLEADLRRAQQQLPTEEPHKIVGGVKVALPKAPEQK